MNAPNVATGTFRWLPRDPDGRPTLEINGQPYSLTKTADGKWQLSYLSEKFQMVCRTVTPRQSSIEPWTCDCPDATERRQGACKHARGLRAAMRQLAYPI